MEIVSGGATPRAFSTSVCIESAPVQTDHLHGKVTHTSETIQSELVDLVQSCGVLEVVLDDIDVVGGGQEAREGRSLGIPQRSRNNPYVPTVCVRL